MNANVGNIDRVIRLIIGIVLAALYFTGNVVGTLGVVLLVVGLVLIATALFKFCPLYKVLGLNTCPR